MKVKLAELEEQKAEKMKSFNEEVLYQTARL